MSYHNLKVLSCSQLESGQFLHRPDMIGDIRSHGRAAMEIPPSFPLDPETSVIPTEVVIADGKPALVHMILPVL